MHHITGIYALSQVLPLQDMLRSAWNTKQYMSASAASQTSSKKQPFLLEESSRATVGHIDDLMQSNYAWDSIAMIAHLAQESDRLGVWAEGCPCPEHAIRPRPQKQPRKKRQNLQPPGAATCPLKCCRAADLATGRAMAMQSVCLDQRVREFTENISNASPERRVELQGTFWKAIARLWGTFATLESQFPMFFFLFIQYSVSSDSPKSFFLVIVCSSNMCLV